MECAEGVGRRVGSIAPHRRRNTSSVFAIATICTTRSAGISARHMAATNAYLVKDAPHHLAEVIVTVRRSLPSGNSVRRVPGLPGHITPDVRLSIITRGSKVPILLMESGTWHMQYLYPLGNAVGGDTRYRDLRARTDDERARRSTLRTLSGMVGADPRSTAHVGIARRRGVRPVRRRMRETLPMTTVRPRPHTHDPFTGHHRYVLRLALASGSIRSPRLMIVPPLILAFAPISTNSSVVGGDSLGF